MVLGKPILHRLLLLSTYGVLIMLTLILFSFWSAMLGSELGKFTPARDNYPSVGKIIISGVFTVIFFITAYGMMA